MGYARTCRAYAVGGGHVGELLLHDGWQNSGRMVHHHLRPHNKMKRSLRLMAARAQFQRQSWICTLYLGVEAV